MDKEIVTVVSFWLAPVLTLVVIATSILQITLSAKKRKDDLFNKRFDFYKRLENYWLSTYNEDIAPLDIVDLIPYMSEATFLFGKDISKHIESLEGEKCSHPFFPDESFSKPFLKYLKL